MLLLTALMATASWSYGFAQEIPVQSPISITKFRKSARMTCEFPTASSLDSSVIHWYQQKEGKAPVRLLYFADGTASVESVFRAERYMVENVPGRNRCVLTISNVVPDDTATYYCAYWDAYHKVFGTGTKLIVSDKLTSAPANSEILQKKHDNQITYVCLIEKFYPEVIRVKWTDGENKEVTDNMVKGDTWKLTKEDKYSISSWLTVPAENKDKNYYCKYEHESQQRSLPTQVHSRKTVSQEDDCITYPGNSTIFNGDHLMHRAAFLVYVVLLLKSSMYYLIVLFFIYRMWAATKNQGKKA
ncbi:T-cell receptor gamma alternate reading frame protein [Melanerpes formicivorus]|uniref:T-cell receptor gamma alternate reading frame protein n=1 Tax=Melanerpes formicivorus TaxID=211600 RepID=UPI00358FFD2B